MFTPEFKRINRISGWILFLISAVTYLLTVEPTVSFWDCGEFILSAWKLQVGHPPGAPFFLILGRVFTLFAFGDQTKAALMVNILSVLASAFTIMFLYWTIVHLVGKIIGEEAVKKNKSISFSIICSGVIGALAYAFSDTFWFSAVEGEVYATSSLFTAIVFWAILKWENEADESYSGRWLVLIAYLMGLSIGVHLLNLLTLPAIVLVYYFRRYKVSNRGIVKALFVSALILFALIFILLPYTLKVAGWFELFSVNTIGLPFNSGLYIYILTLIAVLVLGIRYSMKKKLVFMNYLFTLLTAIMIGYSSIALIMIRANARPPMNQNDPSDPFSLIYYVNREQYGSTPLLSGHYYSAPVVDVNKKTGGYIKTEGKYERYTRNKYEYDSRFTTILPRMYSDQPDHIREYRYWANIKGKKVNLATGAGNQEYIVPTFGENLKFFFRYQVGYMYWRYFMWNFAGRQNDIQGNGNVLHGNWISGITGIDNIRLGNNSNMPASLRDNPGRNTYYFLPLLLGIAGMIWQYRKRRNSFWVVLTFFVMTGLAIVVYLNQYPLQPRERDYAYAASFYAFTIWIGMGFYMLFELLSRLMGRKFALPLSFILALVFVPLLMLQQNRDDHNRSGRYTARDIGANYLNSVDKNAILFTYGDNDSFPLWYAQDVEGVRTDVRVANLSYLNAGWYIEMMRQRAYESDPLPLTLEKEKYYPGSREQLPVVTQITRPVDIKDVLNFVAMDDRTAKIDFTGRGDYFNYIPVKDFIIPVDTNRVKENGTVRPELYDRITENIIWSYPGREMYKNDLVIMDLLTTNKWERPLYYSTTVPPQNYKGLDKYFQMEGLAYRVVPVDTTHVRQPEYGEVDTDKMYNNMMTEFKWGNANDPKVYLDENNRRMFSNFRRMFGILANELSLEGDTTRAIDVLKRCREVIPDQKVPNGYYSINLLEAYFLAGEYDEGRELCGQIVDRSIEILDYIIGLDRSFRYGLDLVNAINLEALRACYSVTMRYGLNDIGARIEEKMEIYYTELYGQQAYR